MADQIEGLDNMEYENLKHMRRNSKEQEVDVDTSVSTAEPPLTDSAAADSNISTQSTSYQTFYSADNQSLSKHVTSQGEHTQQAGEDGQETLASAATYAYPRRSKIINRPPEVDEEGYATAYTSTDSRRKMHPQPTSPVPSVPVMPPPTNDRQLTLPSANSLSNDDNSVSQMRESTAPPSLQPTRKTSDSVEVRSQSKGHPAAKQSLSVGSGSVSPYKPMIMKMLPLYLCLDDGKVYADRNTTSIPTHHLVEVRELERKIMQSVNQISSNPPPDSHGDGDPLTHPNPVYETLPKDLVSHVHGKVAAAVTDQPQGSDSSSKQSSPTPQAQTEALPPSNLNSSTNATLETTDRVTATAPKPTTINTDQEYPVSTQARVYVNPTTSSQLIGHESTPTDREFQGSPVDVALPERRYSFGYHTNGFSSRPLESVHSYLYFTIVAAIVVGLCLDFVVLLSCFLPALWFANKASWSKHNGSTVDAKKYSKRALLLNVVGGALHVLFIILVVIVFFVLVLR